NIWIVGVEGGTPRRFTAGPRRDIEPRWSPDGTRLAFLSERAPRDKLQLYVLPADGGEPTKLTALEHGVSPRPRARSCSLRSRRTGARLPFSRAPGSTPTAATSSSSRYRRKAARPSASRRR